ncbi:MAG: urease accessory protein UreF [Methylococcales bacterium]|nr:urease accessory protein UreF [Methylococcales bacterium]MDP3840688.1 urease accessory protein UreF [Methylococcales bacterium]
MINDVALLRLLQLVSAGLPIGMYSYSQGLERAVDDGWVSNADQAREWLHGIMATALTQTDIPILLRLMEAWSHNDTEQVLMWSRTLTAYRETSELRAEDRQTGQALARLLDALDFPEAKAWQKQPEASLATLFSLAAVRWNIPKHQAALGYLWSWLDNQVLCAVKLVPLGQVAGQRLLTELSALIPAHINNAFRLTDDELGGSAFGLALASSRHEMQYSRLFRS